MKRFTRFMLTMLLILLLLIIAASCNSQIDSTTAETTQHLFISSTEVTTEQPGDSTTSSAITTTTQPITSATTSKPTVTTTLPVVTTEPENNLPTPEKGTLIQVTYRINNPDAGSISGSKSQIVRFGETSTQAVTVTPNLGYKFVGWSDGKTEAVRSDCPRENSTFTAIFEFDALELPILDLRTNSGKDVTDKYTYVPGTISVTNAPDGFNFENLAMEIRGRGNYTWGTTFNADPMYNKRPYRIKLSEKMNLLGQGNGKAKSWVLIANHCDQSLLRNQTVMNFARMLTGIQWEPSATSVDVYLNGEYIGVYMLTEQVQVNSNRINISEEVESSGEVAFLAHMSNYAYNEPDNTSFHYDGRDYEIVSDLSTKTLLKNEQMAYIQSRIGECWDAVKEGDKDTVLALMDINSVIDTLIVHEFFKNLDTGHDNFYMYAEVDGKLYFGPVWDFDQCAGNANDTVETYEGLRGSYTNPWYSTLLTKKWFKELLLARWDELYANEIQSVPAYIRQNAKSAYKAYCRNFERWKILGYTDAYGQKQMGYKINRELDNIRYFQTYDEHYEYFAQWMESRILWLNNYYHSPEFIAQEIKLNLEGKGTQAVPYLINTAEDFYNFSMVMTSGETFVGKYFKQTADIDMSTINYYNGIGANCTFAGVYDGQGFKINVNIRSGSDGCPFPYVSGTLMNVFTTGSVRNSGIAAGIARSVRVGGIIVNCGSSCTLVSTGMHAGGITASNETGGGSIIGCFFIGTIEASIFGPINEYRPGRAVGDCKYNYFVRTYCADELYDYGSYLELTETAITQSQLKTLHQTLNNNLGSVAALAKINRASLKSWTALN